MAEATPLQTNTGQVAKTIESKQIQDLMLNGRNPINLALLKPGVRGGAGGSLNSFQPDSLSNGGFNINGSRSDENLITIDGAIATRTRSAGAIIGTVNVDTVSGDPDPHRELPARIRPLLGRPDPVRDQGRRPRLPRRRVRVLPRREPGRQLLGAQQQPAAGAEQPARALQLQPVRLRHRRARSSSPASSTPNRDKLFFFWAQEWIHYDREETNTRTVPTAAMRRGDFSELLSPTNPFFGRAVAGPRPAHRPALPGQRHPVEPAEPERARPCSTPTRCPRRASSAAPTTGSAPAPTRGARARTPCASTSCPTRRTRSRSAGRSSTGRRWTPSAATSRSRARTGTGPTRRRR